MKKKIMAVAFLGIMAVGGTTLAANYGDIKGDYSEMGEQRAMSSQSTDCASYMKNSGMTNSREKMMNDQDMNQMMNEMTRTR